MFDHTPSVSDSHSDARVIAASFVDGFTVDMDWLENHIAEREIAAAEAEEEARAEARLDEAMAAKEADAANLPINHTASRMGKDALQWMVDHPADSCWDNKGLMIAIYGFELIGRDLGGKRIID